ncbi:hypothetical protein [Actinoplanes sp. HUAS TT8]|uniref:hypothetical protein n=1 Tax=Actinoplanes sp. HUAS TT8 TaxID=3447453 RepID=UPI003F522A35
MASVTATLGEKRVLYGKYLRAVEDMIDQITATMDLHREHRQLSASDDGNQRETASLNDRFAANATSLLEQIVTASGELRRLRAEISVLGGQQLGNLVSATNVALLESGKRALADGVDDGHYFDPLDAVVDALHQDVARQP